MTIQRTINKVDKKACELIKEFKTISIEVADLQTQIEKLEAERNKLGMKGQKIKDKLEPIKDRLVGKETGEFEIVTNMKLGKDPDSIEIEVIDTVEQYKDAYRKRGQQTEPAK